MVQKRWVLNMDKPTISNRFTIGDIVLVKHDTALGNCEVVNPCDPTNMVLITGKAVGYYVRVKDSTGEILGYHETSLQLV